MEKPINEMTLDELMHEVSRDERFKAVVAAMHALCIAKGVYSSKEFVEYFEQTLRPRLKREREGRGFEDLL